MAFFTPQDYINMGITADELRGLRQKYASWQGDDEYYRWVKKESDIGKKTTGGGAGAVGVHQLLPGTFDELMPNGDINNPLHNAQAGMMYLTRGYEKFKGNKRDTYMGYHGGHAGKGTANWGPITNAYADYIIGDGNPGASVFAGSGSIQDPETTGPLDTPTKVQQMQAAYNQGIQQQQKRAKPMSPFGDIMTMQQRYAPGVENILAAYNQQRAR